MCRYQHASHAISLLQVLTRMPTTCDVKDDNVIVLSCEEDKELCIKSNIKKAYTAELLLTGILKQELDLKQYPFFQHILIPFQLIYIKVSKKELSKNHIALESYFHSLKQ